MAASLPFPPYPSSSEPPELHPGVRQQLDSPSSEGSLLLELRSRADYVVHCLGSTHPAEYLPGRYATNEAVGMALVMPGSVLYGDHPDLAVTGEVRAAQVVGANGSSSAVVQWSGGTMVDHQPVPGRLSDLLFRMLQLPTPGCELAAGWYWASVWLAEVFETGVKCPDRWPAPSPEEMLSWHPAIDPREVRGLSPAGLESLLLDRHRDHARLSGWASIRSSAIAGWLEVGWCPPSVAGWLDDGSFGRWIGVDLPSPVELVEVAQHLLNSECSRLVISLLVDLARQQGVDS